MLVTHTALSYLKNWVDALCGRSECSTLIFCRRCSYPGTIVVELINIKMKKVRRAPIYQRHSTY